MKNSKFIFWSYLLGSLFLYSNLIDSETLTITTYYPAPYGGYVRLLTTNATVLARDGGSVGIGVAAPLQKLDVSANAYIRGAVGIGVQNPVYALDVAGSSRFSQDGRFGGRIGTNGYDPVVGIPGGWGGGIHTWDAYAEGSFGTGTGGALNWNVNSTGLMTFSASGRISGICRLVYYGTAGGVGCNANEAVMGYFGDGVRRVFEFTLRPYCNVNDPNCWTPMAGGYDWAGWMYCCKVQ